MAANTHPDPDEGGRHPRIVAAWLFTVAAMIFAMIVLGGATRLTQSGLSMVDWRPLTGWLPPIGEDQWHEAFERYRAFPEYRERNAGMTLEAFKGIFWLEYAHRLWGRLIGVVFLVPLVWFIAKGWIGRALAPKLTGLFVLGGLQGLLGWSMVQSGLVDRPDVSQYRLAAHLGLALVILAAVQWVALGLLRGTRKPDPARVIPAERLAPLAAVLTGLVFVTALSGAFVAGLDAGLTYNTFPLMDGHLVPSGLFTLSPGWRNLFENVTTVQFDHRLLAVTTVVATVAFWAYARRLAPGGDGRRALDLMAALALVQGGLGISTLVLVVPVGLAVTHQGGAVALLMTSLWLAHALRYPIPE